MKKLITSTILITFIILGIGAFYIFPKNHNNTSENNKAVTETEITPTSNPKLTPGETPKLGNTGTIDKFLLWSNGTQLRGANIYQRRVYVELDGTDYMGEGSLGPPLVQADFDNLAKAGSNLVVLSHPGLFDEKPPYALNNNIQDNLDRLIGMAEKANLFVVIAARTGPGRSEFDILRDGSGKWFDPSYFNDDVWKNKSAQDAYVAMWKHTAARYRNRSVIVGYELMVEPNPDNALLGIDNPTEFYPKYENTTYDWNILASRISKAIREVDSEMPIIIGGMGYSGARWLPYIKPIADDRTVYNFHQYEPQEFYTHQSEDREMPLINFYPGKFDTNGDGVVRDFNKAWIDDLLTIVDRFKTKNNVPVAVTEYGIVRWEPGADAFLDDEMELFDRRGLNYAIWEWAPSYKPLTDDYNSFNFRFGPEQKTIENTNSKLFNVIKKYWKKNTTRPYGQKTIRPAMYIQSVKSSPVLKNKAAVEIILSAGKEFPVRNEITVLRIGSKNFTLSRYPENGDIHTLIFTLTPEEFSQTATGDTVTVQYGLGSESGEQWDFGKLDKSLLDKKML